MLEIFDKFFPLLVGAGILATFVYSMLNTEWVVSNENQIRSATSSSNNRIDLWLKDNDIGQDDLLFGGPIRKGSHWVVFSRRRGEWIDLPKDMEY
jgi:hypothetical protein